MDFDGWTYDDFLRRLEAIRNFGTFEELASRIPGMDALAPDMRRLGVRHFLTISRGSIFEAVAILQQIFDMNLIPSEKYEELYEKYEQSSKMLLGMFRSYDK